MLGVVPRWSGSMLAMAWRGVCALCGVAEAAGGGAVERVVEEIGEGMV